MKGKLKMEQMERREKMNGRSFQCRSFWLSIVTHFFTRWRLMFTHTFFSSSFCKLYSIRCQLNGMNHSMCVLYRMCVRVNRWYFFYPAVFIFVSFVEKTTKDRAVQFTLQTGELCALSRWIMGDLQNTVTSNNCPIIKSEQTHIHTHTGTKQTIQKLMRLVLQ